MDNEDIKYSSDMGYFSLTGLLDSRGQDIRIGHIVRLKLEDGSIRDFEVRYETVQREVVNLNGFEGETSKVAITGIVFDWRGHKLFPCIDRNGIPDNEKMLIVGINSINI